MCTVSFISSPTHIFITSNRDEHDSRPVSLKPIEKNINGLKILYPEDPKGKGTWFAVNNYGGVCVLLNGAFEKHIRKESYAMSRGLILLNIISTTNPVESVQKLDLTNIEPFTLVLLVNNRLFEFRWNEEEKFLNELDFNKSYLWSSATLYDKEVRSRREDLFTQFLSRQSNKNSSDILDFHLGDTNDLENGFVIHRKTGLKTFSITQAVIHKNLLTLNHKNLHNTETYTNSVPWNKKLIYTNE